MITDADLDEKLSAKRGKKGKYAKVTQDKALALDEMLAVFDPETDKKDRRILFEVAKVRLDESEFRERDSSDSQESDSDSGMNEMLLDVNKSARYPLFDGSNKN